MKRRGFLLGGLGATGALLLGWGLLPPRSRLGDAEVLPLQSGETALNGWIKIATDGSVRLAMPRAEMGQGVHTALAMLVAEELCVDLEQVQVVPAGPETIYANLASISTTMLAHPGETGLSDAALPRRVGLWMLAKGGRALGIQVTGGSSSIADAWEFLPLVAATARTQLLGAASLKWHVPLTDLSVAQGVIRHPELGLKAHYGELAEQAARTPVGKVELLLRGNRRVIGQALPRLDLAAKVNGSARFGLDVRQPQQLFAAVRQAPMLGGSVRKVDTETLLKRANVLHVVLLPARAGSTAGIAVVARTTWHARQALDAAQIEWQAPAGAALDTHQIAEQLTAAARQAAAAEAGRVMYSQGDADSLLKSAAAQADAAASAASGSTTEPSANPNGRVIEAAYRAPYLAHMAMEPLNCTAQIKDGHVTLWLPTQAPSASRAEAARVADVAEDAVTLHATYLGGSFGRRLEVDVVAQAVHVAMQVGGVPVQLVWPREEDPTHDFYRPAGAALLRATLGADGLPTALVIGSAGDSITPRHTERTMPGLALPFDLPDKTNGEGLTRLPYQIEHQRIQHVATRSGVPVGYLRAVGHSHHGFFIEGFIDELAKAAGQNALAYRLALLQGRPLHKAVLQRAADAADWSKPPASGHARGLALHESYGSIVAMVIEASISGSGDSRKVRLHRVVCAVDCGTVVNPGIVAQQIESGVIDGLNTALHGRIDIRDGVVQQRNFTDLPLLSLADTPPIQTELIDSDRAPGGVGEIAVPPVAPALASALFALTGQRLRELPLRLA